jgi:hypothetical protein
MLININPEPAFFPETVHALKFAALLSDLKITTHDSFTPQWCQRTPQPASASKRRPALKTPRTPQPSSSRTVLGNMPSASVNARDGSTSNTTGQFRHTEQWSNMQQAKETARQLQLSLEDTYEEMRRVWNVVPVRVAVKDITSTSSDPLFTSSPPVQPKQGPPLLVPSTTPPRTIPSLQDVNVLLSAPPTLLPDDHGHDHGFIRPQPSVGEGNIKQAMLHELEVAVESCTRAQEEATRLRELLRAEKDKRARAEHMLAQLRTNIENPFNSISTQEQVTMMQQGQCFTRILRHSKTTGKHKTQNIFLFFRHVGTVGEMHWFAYKGNKSGGALPNGMLLRTGETSTQSLTLRSVTGVHRGKQTVAMQSKAASKFTAKCCFSFVTPDGGLDVAADTPEKAFAWLYGINIIMGKIGRSVGVHVASKASR